MSSAGDWLCLAGEGERAGRVVLMFEYLDFSLSVSDRIRLSYCCVPGLWGGGTRVAPPV